MIRYFGQAQYSPTRILTGYELLLRQCSGGTWQFPRDFRQHGAAEMQQLAAATIAVLEPAARVVSINLDQDQFVMPEFVRMFTQLVHDFPKREIVVELTERDCSVPMAELRQAAAAYAGSGAYVCMDDVGSGANSPQMADALDDYVSEYKFAMQNFNERDGSISNLMPQIAAWAQRAKQFQKEFVVEGIETERNLKIVEQFTPNIIQGFLFAKPALIPVQQDIF